MATGRPKRAAATKKKVPIIISDSSEDEDDIKPYKINNNVIDLDDSFRLSEELSINSKKRNVTKKSEAAPSSEDVVVPKKRGRPAKAAQNNDECKIELKLPKVEKNVDSVTNVDSTVQASNLKRQKIDTDCDTKPGSSKRQKVEKQDTIDGSCISTQKSQSCNTLQISTCKSTNFVQPWNEPQLLAEFQQIDHYTAANIIKLFREDNTIPFICRYRKELIGSDMTPDRLRDIKVTFNHILNIKSRCETIVRNLEKDNKLNDDIQRNLLCAKSLDELDHLYAPYKPASKASLAERAKNLGLQLPAEQILFCPTGQEIVPAQLVQQNVDGLETTDKVVDGIKHIISHLISKDTQVLDEIRNLEKRYQIMIHSTVSKVKSESKSTTADKSEKSAKPVDASKFETYFDFKTSVRWAKPHQILAINRGENLKVLTVKIIIPDGLKNDLWSFIGRNFLHKGIFYQSRIDIVQAAFNEAYNKKLQPLISRQQRAELTKAAEKASIDVFATNLKQLLLMSPVKGERILGIDPGFSNGCKIALISECSDILDTAVIYPHTQQKKSFLYGQQIAKMLVKHNCKLIALGNGTACRETEKWIADLMDEGIFDSKTVRYSIVTEQGASIYSCGDIAKKEFPNLDINLISAVSIARRLNDPLCEFVKVEPKHLGVGMYQHDVNEKLLTESLNEVVMECVSFVGVDINTASASLLRHVAGLTSVRAENIIKYRVDNGPFKSRDELKKVKQIGEKSFVQCAGFIRIEPLTAGIKSNDLKYNRLDLTWVHPESYDSAEKILRKCGLKSADVGTILACNKIKEFSLKTNIKQLAMELGNLPEERVQSVLDALQRELLRDYRADFDKKPLFKQGLTKMSDLQTGTVVTGAITNITHFGCFVDIGVERDGLIHVSQLRGMKPVIGDRIEAIVTNIEISRGRIQLSLQRIL